MKDLLNKHVVILATYDGEVAYAFPRYRFLRRPLIFADLLACYVSQAVFTTARSGSLTFMFLLTYPFPSDVLLVDHSTFILRYLKLANILLLLCLRLVKQE